MHFNFDGIISFHNLEVHFCRNVITIWTYYTHWDSYFLC